eukprot:SAG22_NODE_16997_length_313_cov_0.967290_1_plen_67_part_10
MRSRTALCTVMSEECAKHHVSVNLFFFYFSMYQVAFSCLAPQSANSYQAAASAAALRSSAAAVAATI